MLARRFLLVLPFVAACSVLTSLDDLRGGSGADGAITDAGGDSGANLMNNPSFEQGSAGCGANWGNGYNATYTRSSPGHTGTYACEVCVQATGTGSYAVQSLVPISVQPGSYYAEAWLSSPDDATATQAGVLVDYSEDGGVTGCNGIGQVCQGSIITPPTGAWAPTTATFTVTTAQTLTLNIHSFADDPGSCFLVDDVLLVQQ